MKHFCIMRYFVLLVFLFLTACQRLEVIKIKGSDTEVNLAVKLAESFKNVNQGCLLSVSGGGSGLGIAALINGTTHIANSSRPINSEELDLFKRSSVQIDSFVFAKDAVAFVSSATLPIDSMSKNQLAAILSGQIVNWKELGGPDLPIQIYGRQSNSGTYEFVRNKLGIRFSDKANQMSGNAQILESVKVDQGAFGYVGAGYVKSGGEGFKVISIYSEGGLAYSPLNPEHVQSGSYLFQRPLLQYFRAQDREKVQPFLDFQSSPEGQRIIEQSGYFPFKPLV